MAVVEETGSQRAERVRAIVLLLETRLDYLPTPRAVQFPSTPGAAASERGKVACGCGRIEHQAVSVAWRADPACLLCKGTGYRRRIAALDGDAQHDERGAIFDEYVYAHDRANKPPTDPGLRVMDADEYDREIARLRSNVAARAGVIGKREAHPWERAREARDKSGSYRELEACLERLRDVDGAAYSVIVRVYCEQRYGQGRRPPYVGPLIIRGLLFLEANMPERVRVPQFLTDARNGDERAAKVVRAYESTGSISKTAHSLGMRKARVKQALRRAGVLA